MKRFKDFLIEKKQDKWIYKGDFIVTEDMVIDGKMIKEKIPDEVTGDFYCYDNQLTSLEGCPSKVGGGFDCSSNQLTSLEGCPSKVGGYFNCSYNQLTSLEGCPSTVGGDFYCYNNQLTSLEGCPSTVGGDFDCYNNLLDLSIEQDFIESGCCSSQENYWLDLLKYMIKQKIDITKITTWPKDFLTPEVIASAKGIVKFNL